MPNQHQPQPTSDLTVAVDALSVEVRVLREVLDEISDALEWRNKNAAEFAEGQLPALPVDSTASDQQSGGEAESAESAPQSCTRDLPLGHALELRFEPSGYRYYLADRALHAADLVEIWLPETGWTRGRYEWSYEPSRPAWISVDDQRAVAVTFERRLRWPVD